jgi:hypothetical protein
LAAELAATPATIRPFDVAPYVETLGLTHSAPAVKQQFAVVATAGRHASRPGSTVRAQRSPGTALIVGKNHIVRRGVRRDRYPAGAEAATGQQVITTAFGRPGPPAGQPEPTSAVFGSACPGTRGQDFAPNDLHLDTS